MSERSGAMGGQWVAARCFSSTNYNKGKTIYLRGKLPYDKITTDWYIFIVPAECLHQCFIIQQTRNNNNNLITSNDNNNNKKKKKHASDKLFNHSLHHTFQLPFQLPYNKVVAQEFADLYDASWITLGSTIYFFGAINRKVYYLERDVASTTFPSSLSFKPAGFMIVQRKEPMVVALDGKIYVFGDNEDVFGEVFEPCPNSYDGLSRPLSSPLPASSPCDISFVIALEIVKKIVVGCVYKFADENSVKWLHPDIVETTSVAVFMFDVSRGLWNRYGSNLFINHRSLLCQPIAVGCCLYWLDTQMHAYDLNTKQYFEGPIQDFLLQNVIEVFSNLSISLLHLVDDFFYMTWVDHHNRNILHCATIQAVRTTTNIHANRFKLRTTVFSCQTFASDLSPLFKDQALRL